MNRTTTTRDYGTTFPADRFVSAFTSGDVSFETARTSLAALSLASLQRLAAELQNHPMLNHGHCLAADIRSMLTTVRIGVDRLEKGTEYDWNNASKVLG